MSSGIVTRRQGANFPFSEKSAPTNYYRRSSLRIAIAASSDDIENDDPSPTESFDFEHDMPPRKKQKRGGFQKKVHIIEPEQEQAQHHQHQQQVISDSDDDDQDILSPVVQDHVEPELPEQHMNGLQQQQQQPQQQQVQVDDVQLRTDGFQIPPKPISLPAPPPTTPEKKTAPSAPAVVEPKLQEKGLASLPVPILTNILKLLQSRELSSLVSTCRTFNQIFKTRKLDICRELGEREGYEIYEIKTLDLYRPGGMTEEARYLIHKYLHWSNSTEQISIPEIMELSPTKGMVYLPELRQLKSNRKYAESWIRQRYPTTFAETRAQKLQKLRGYFLITTTFLANLHPFPRIPLRSKSKKRPRQSDPFDPTGLSSFSTPEPSPEDDLPTYDPLEPDNRLIFDHSSCHTLPPEDWSLYWNMIETIEFARIFHPPTSQWLGVYAPICYRDRCFEAELTRFMTTISLANRAKAEKKYWSWDGRRFEKMTVWTGQEADIETRFERDETGAKREVQRRGWKSIIVKRYEFDTHVKQRREWAWRQRQERKKLEREARALLKEQEEAAAKALEEERRIAEGLPISDEPSPDVGMVDVDAVLHTPLEPVPEVPMEEGEAGVEVEGEGEKNEEEAKPERDPNLPEIAAERRDAKEAPIQNLFLRWKCVYHDRLGIDENSWGETGEVKEENPYF